MRIKRTPHPRAELTNECVVHQAWYTIPCWCGVTDAIPPGMNVLSRERWTDECVFWFISWIQATQKQDKSAA